MSTPGPAVRLSVCRAPSLATGGGQGPVRVSCGVVVVEMLDAEG